MTDDDMQDLELEARLFAIEVLIGPMLALIAQSKGQDFLRDLHEKIVGGIMAMDAKAPQFRELLVLKIEQYFVQAGAITARN